MGSIQEEVKELGKAEDDVKKEPEKNAVKEIRRFGRKLFVLDVIAKIIFTLLHEMHFINHSYYLIMIIISLNIFAFAWIFRSVVVWGGTKKGKYPAGANYISIGESPPIWILMLLDTFFVGFPLTYKIQCVHGQERMIFAGVAVFLVLFLISVFRIGYKDSKIVEWAIIGIFSAIFSLLLTIAVFYSTSSAPVYYQTVVWDSGEDDGYCLQVLLRNGEKQWLTVTKPVYEAVKDGGIVKLSERTGIFDTEFVEVYLPE